MHGRVSEPVVVTAFLAMTVAIGANVVAIVFVLREPGMGPLWAAASRFMVATALFAVLAAAARAPFPRGGALVGTVLYGALQFGAFFGLVYWGLDRGVPAALAGVLLATAPLLTFLFALAHGQERFRWDSLAGAGIVIAGTAVVLIEGLGEGSPILPMLAIVAAAACNAEAAVIVKAFPGAHPMMRNSVGLAVGSAVLLVLVPLFGESIVMPTLAATWLGQAYLVTAGTIGVFGLYLFLLSRWTASAVSYEFVLAPLVGILLAVWLLDESISGWFVAGTVLVLAGVYLGAIRPLREPTPALAEVAG